MDDMLLANSVNSSLGELNAQLGGIVENDGFLDMLSNFIPLIQWFAVIILVFVGVRVIIKVVKGVTK